MAHQTHCDCDQCLLTQMRSTDATERQKGWDTWYQRDALALHTFIQRRCQIHQFLEHSEDILHDTFLIGFRNVSTGRYSEQNKSLSAYLHGIAKNLTYEAVRIQWKTATDTDQLEIQESRQLSLEDQLYAKEVLALIREGYEQQPPLYQQVIDGLYIDNQSAEEMAQKLRKTAGNIRAIAYRAIHEIEKYLERQYKLQLSSKAIRSCLEGF